MCCQPLPEDQLPEVLVTCYERCPERRRPSQYLVVRRPGAGSATYSTPCPSARKRSTIWRSTPSSQMRFTRLCRKLGRPRRREALQLQS